MNRPTFENRAALGFSDVEISAQLEIPLAEVWQRLASLPAEARRTAEAARLQTEKITKPFEYWLHGDFREFDMKYYCGCCDSFESDVHFVTHSREVNLRKLAHSKEVLSFFAGQRAVIRCGDVDCNIIETTLSAEKTARLKAIERGDL